MKKQERPADGWSWEISPNRPYFFFDPEAQGFEYFATEKERDEAAESAIQAYLDDGWSEEVTNVLAGVLTHTSEQFDLKTRPAELDEDEMDAEGNDWSHIFDCICNYKLFPLSERGGVKNDESYNDDA